MTMADELSIISSSMLTDVSENEIDSLINKIVSETKENMEEICSLTLDCTALLSSAFNRSTALSEQSVFGRWVGNITGKNNRLRDAIIKDQANALYAAQGIINRIMAECSNNRALMLAINDRVNDIYLELKNDHNELAEGVLNVRKAIVTFYQQYREEHTEHEERISSIEQLAKERCPKCNNEIGVWQRVCPYCGEIHPLKVDNLSDEAMKVVRELSKAVSFDEGFEDILWDAVARKKARVIAKVKKIAKLGRLPGFTSEIERDINDLINKCRGEDFQIAIVGVMKAGKSVLMNALIGEEIASVDVNPETSALTKFKSASGYYLKIRWQNEEEWAKLQNSALKSNNDREDSDDSLRSILKGRSIADLKKRWIGHDETFIPCKSIDELRSEVKKYTSSGDTRHLFVAEVEVGVDSSIFNMPKEVVFVDTPGLLDPVTYRSDITKAYIKRADAVLIAVPTEALNGPAYEIITTVLDLTSAEKTYIVATKKDIRSKKDECDRIISLWVKQLLKAQRYKNERSVRNRITLTSAKMHLLLNKFIDLSADQRADEEFFSERDYIDLERFVRILLGKRYDLMELPGAETKVEEVIQDAGIEILRKKLQKELIDKHRELKLARIQSDFVLLAKRIKDICKDVIRERSQNISHARKGADELKRRLSAAKRERQEQELSNRAIRKAVDELNKEINKIVDALKRKGE